MASPQWPAIIEFTGQAELALIRDQSQWDSELQLHSSSFRSHDRLIDSLGSVFNLSNKELLSSGKSIGLDELVRLIQAHASQNGECCVAKFSAISIAEAIQMLSAMEPD